MRGGVEVCSRRHKCGFLALLGSVWVSQVVYCIGSDRFEGVSRLLDAVVRFCDRGFEENAFQDAAPAT